MATYQYLTIGFDEMMKLGSALSTEQPLQAYLNQMGASGWEVVAVIEYKVNKTQREDQAFVLKKTLP